MKVNPGLDPSEVSGIRCPCRKRTPTGSAGRESLLRRFACPPKDCRACVDWRDQSLLPLSGANAGRGPDDRRAGGGNAERQRPSAAYRLTCPGYFATLGITLLEGRGLRRTATPTPAASPWWDCQPDRWPRSILAAGQKARSAGQLEAGSAGRRATPG